MILNIVFGYLAVGMVISLGISVADFIQHWRGKNDGVMADEILIANVLLWPYFGFILAREYLEHRRDTKRRRRP